MFQFKQFKIEDDQSTMKVGTDGVLVGAWADVNGAESILDIGTGCGLIALMMAQRSKAKRIDAIEIDRASAEQAKQNVENSPWKERIRVIKASLQNFCKEGTEAYDLLISNPPFFENALKPFTGKKNLSKHTSTLNYGELLYHTARMMHIKSRFCVILPVDQKNRFESLALSEGLYCNHELSILPREGKTPKRAMLELSKQKGVKVKKQIAILSMDGSYSEEYRQLTKEFYLHF